MSYRHDYDINPFDDDDEGVVCERCGAEDLHFVDTAYGPRLFTHTHHRHVCPLATPLDFDDLTAQ